MSRRASAAKRKIDEQSSVMTDAVPAAPAKRPPATAAGRSARHLQQEVAAAAAAGAFDTWREDRPDRWSTRRTLAFILVTCSAFWLCLGLALTRLS